jgi:hypothetical protein
LPPPAVFWTFFTLYLHNRDKRIATANYNPSLDGTTSEDGSFDKDRELAIEQEAERKREA